MTQTATEQGTGIPYLTPGATPTLGTPEFFDPFGSPTPSRTPGINLTCPDETFDTAGLDYDWAMVCGACIRNVRGTPTPPYGVPPLNLPSLNLSTFTPQPTDYLSPTPSNTPTPTATLPSPTPTPTGGCGWSYRFWFNTSNGYPYVTALNSKTVSSGTSGSWNGSAWVHGDGVCCTNIYNRQVGLDIVFPQTANLTYVSVNYDATWGAGTTSNVGLQMWPGSGSAAVRTRAQLLEGSNRTYTFEGFAAPGVPEVWVQLFLSWGGNSGSYSGSGAIHWIEVGGTGTNPFTGQTGCPTATPTLTPTPTPTNTPLPGTPSATPEWWATSFPQYAGLSVDCSQPRYIDLDKPLVAWGVGPSESDPVCLTVLPYLNIGFDLINSTAGQIFGFQIPPIIFQQVNVCFVGISVMINFLGFQLDMSILLGVPILAYLLRWVLFQ